jgi:hypothetical protein
VRLFLVFNTNFISHMCHTFLSLYRVTINFVCLNLFCMLLYPLQIRMLLYIFYNGVSGVVFLNYACMITLL